MTGSVSSSDTSATTAGKAGSRGPAGRILPPGRIGLLIAGDTAVFLLFAGLGLRQHNQGTASGLAASAVLVTTTALPFAAGWFLVSPFLRAFSRSHTSGMLPMLRQTEIAWLCSWPVTLVLRWMFSTDHRVPLSFAAVILVANAVFLGVWRSIFALVAGRRSSIRSS
jgi:hypothetical protein